LERVTEYLTAIEDPTRLDLVRRCFYLKVCEKLSRERACVGWRAGKWDNSPVMEEILALRHELAQLLGFENYAHESLATKMAENP
ncbi:class I adenylate cyclase, partial [Salmonella enterica subsp. enterica serovar Montevideo]|nr:class I adenylate cyclase [Salmonella enterica subsp. enterica serovar Montevideo]